MSIKFPGPVAWSDVHSPGIQRVASKAEYRDLGGDKIWFTMWVQQLVLEIGQEFTIDIQKA